MNLDQSVFQQAIFGRASNASIWIKERAIWPRSRRMFYRPAGGANARRTFPVSWRAVDFWLQIIGQPLDKIPHNQLIEDRRWVGRPRMVFAPVGGAHLLHPGPEPEAGAGHLLLAARK